MQQARDHAASLIGVLEDSRGSVGAVCARLFAHQLLNVDNLEWSELTFTQHWLAQGVSRIASFEILVVVVLVAALVVS